MINCTESQAVFRLKHEACHSNDKTVGNIFENTDISRWNPMNQFSHDIYNFFINEMKLKVEYVKKEVNLRQILFNFCRSILSFGNWIKLKQDLMVGRIERHFSDMNASVFPYSACSICSPSYFLRY